MTGYSSIATTGVSPNSINLALTFLASSHSSLDSAIIMSPNLLKPLSFKICAWMLCCWLLPNQPFANDFNSSTFVINNSPSFYNNASTHLLTFSIFSVGSNLSTTSPFLSTKNLVKFHLISDFSI